MEQCSSLLGGGESIPGATVGNDVMFHSDALGVKRIEDQSKPKHLP